MKAYQHESEKDLRLKLYRRQCRLNNIKTGNESVCLPGQLLRLNPNFLNTRPKSK